MSFMERMLKKATSGESEEARLAREKDAREIAKDRTTAEEAERLLKSLEAAASELSEEEIEAGLEKAKKGAEKKAQYPDKPSQPPMEKAA